MFCDIKANRNWLDRVALDVNKVEHEEQGGQSLNSQGKKIVCYEAQLQRVESQ
jgi:hypothetical protein